MPFIIGCGGALELEDSVFAVPAAAAAKLRLSALAFAVVVPLTMATLSCPYGKYDMLKLARSVIWAGAVQAVCALAIELLLAMVELGSVVTTVWVTVAGGMETVTVTGGGVLVAITVTTLVTG